ncbi:hypothetical protein ES703_27679 [subsurface metagenome]
MYEIGWTLWYGQSLAQVTQGNSTGAAGGITARDPDIAGHGGQGARRTVILLAEGRPPRRPAGIKGGRFEGSVVPGQLLYGFGGHAGDILGPLGCFGHTIFFAHYIILKLLEADGISLDEVLVIHHLINHDMGHGQEHRGVCSGLYGYPLFGQRFCGNGVSRVNADNFHSRFLCSGQVVDGVGAEAGDHRVPAPHNEQSGMEKIIAAGSGESGAKSNQRGKNSRFQRRIAPPGGATSEEGEKAAANFLIGTMQRTHRAGMVHEKYGAVPVYRSLTLWSSRATVSSASSHEIGSNFPLPLSPTLFNGCLRRFSAYTISFLARPRGQAFRPGIGPSPVSIRVMTPSLTCTFSRHRPPQS